MSENIKNLRPGDRFSVSFGKKIYTTKSFVGASGEEYASYDSARRDNPEGIIIINVCETNGSVNPEKITKIFPGKI